MRLIMMLLAILLLALGIISWVTPIPGGTLMLALGLTLLICSSESAAKFLKNYRRKFPKLNKVMSWIEGKTPKILSEAIQRTRP